MPRALRHASALTIAFVLAALAGCQRQPPVVTEADKAMIVRAGDLKEHGWEFGDPAPLEKFTKTRWWDGTYDVVYEFETPDSEVEYPLYLNVTVTVEHMASDALLTQGAERVGLNIGLQGDMTIREIDGFHPGATFAVLEADGDPVGNYFSMRKGNKVYTLLMSGFYFDDPEAWRELVDAKLRLFAGEAPSGAKPAPAPPQPEPFVAARPASEDATVHLRLSAPPAHALYVDNCNGAFPWGLERQDGDRWEGAWNAELDGCLSAPIVVAPGTSREFALAVGGGPGPALNAGTYRAVVHGLYAEYDTADPRANVVLAPDRRTSAPVRFDPADRP